MKKKIKDHENGGTKEVLRENDSEGKSEKGEGLSKSSSVNAEEHQADKETNKGSKNEIKGDTENHDGKEKDKKYEKEEGPDKKDEHDVNENKDSVRRTKSDAGEKSEDGKSIKREKHPAGKNEDTNIDNTKKSSNQMPKIEEKVTKGIHKGGKSSEILGKINDREISEDVEEDSLKIVKEFHGRTKEDRRNCDSDTRKDKNRDTSGWKSCTSTKGIVEKLRTKKILASLQNPTPTNKMLHRTSKRVTSKRKKTTLVKKKTSASPTHYIEDFCKFKHTGSYPNMMDCTKYWVCAGGKTYAAQCPPGLVFNFKIYSCDTRDSIPMVIEDYFWMSCNPKGARHARPEKYNVIAQYNGNGKKTTARSSSNRPNHEPGLLIGMPKDTMRMIDGPSKKIKLGNSPLW